LTGEEEVRLFLYNCAVVHRGLSSQENSVDGQPKIRINSERHELSAYVSQFSRKNQDNAHAMTEWYMLFYMLENDIRQFITDTLEIKDQANWWSTCVPEAVRKEVEFNRQRERDFGFQHRSDDLLDYATFGQLADVIRDNWDVFGGVLSSQKAVGRVMATLNALRGPIAHCGVLAPDEIDRLKLSVKDWFRVLAGPQ
jgi:hypothetical protein